jgi:hypothetical protein
LSPQHVECKNNLTDLPPQGSLIPVQPLEASIVEFCQLQEAPGNIEFELGLDDNAFRTITGDVPV